MKTGMCTLIAGLLMLSPAYAEPTAADVLAALGGSHPDQLVKVIAEGFSWANASLSSDGKPPLFCTPQNLVLTPEQEIDILKRYVQDKPKFGGVEVGFALMEALKHAFPCKVTRR
jgi:hypothetical protein